MSESKDYCHKFNEVHPDYFGETDGYVYWAVRKTPDKDSTLKMANEQIMQFIAEEPTENVCFIALSLG